MSGSLLPFDDGVTPIGSVPRRVMPLDDGRSIAWAEKGHGPDLLAIHGTLMTLDDMWLGPTDALSRHFRVVAVDRPGHGLSLRQRVIDASPWRQAEILHSFAQAAGLRRPILLGHSFGGAVALAYASLFPGEVGGIVALAPLCLPEPRLEMMLLGPRAVPLAGDLIAPMAGVTVDTLLLPALWRAMFLPQTMPAHYAAEFPFHLAAQFGQMIAGGEDSLAATAGLIRLARNYASCPVPARFLCGTADIVINNALQGRLAASAMPNATFEWLPGLGHMIHHHAIEKVIAAALSLRQEPA